MIKEVHLDSENIPTVNAIGLLGINDEWNIFIIETKLAKNDEIRRKIIGQILEYSVFLHIKDVDWLDEIVKTKSTKE